MHSSCSVSRQDVRPPFGFQSRRWLALLRHIHEPSQRRLIWKVCRKMARMSKLSDDSIIGSSNHRIRKSLKGKSSKKNYSQAKPSRPEFAHPINALHCKEARARMSSCVLGVRIKMVFCFVLFTRRRSLQLQALIRRAFWHTLMTGGLRHQIINNTRVATSKREEENMRCGVISRLSQVDR